MGPAYLWTLNPDIQMISASYSSTPVKEFSSKFRKLINSDSFKKLYPNLVLSEDNVTSQKNNSKGARYTASTGGSVTGMHADIIVLDDPNKPPSIIRDDNGNPRLEQGATITEILNGNAWHDDVLTTRKTDKKMARTIYVQQRVHRQDLSGYILKKAEKGGMDLKHICLPARINMRLTRLQAYARLYRNGNIVEQINLKYLYSKEGLLDNQRLSANELDKAKIVMGSYAYNAQYLQRPSKDKGGLIKANYFEVVEASTIPIDKMVKYFYTDPSEGKASSDNMATVCWGLYEGTVYIFEIMAVVLPFNEFIGYESQGKWVDKVYDKFVKKHGITKQTINFFESKSSGTPYLQYINARTPYNAVPDNPQGSKMDRVSISLPTWEAGRVKFVKGIAGVNSDWIGETIEELSNFSGRDGDPDDRVDVLTAIVKRTSFDGSSLILESKVDDKVQQFFDDKKELDPESELLSFFGK